MARADKPYAGLRVGVKNGGCAGQEYVLEYAEAADPMDEVVQDKGVTINRPPRDGHMAFVRSPDGISIELLQKGERLEPAEPWLSMKNTGSW